MEEGYWRPGNGAAFLDLVQQLTGQPLSADAWVEQLKEPVASLLQTEEQDYKQAVQQGPKLKSGGFTTAMPGYQVFCWKLPCLRGHVVTERDAAESCTGNWTS